MIAGARDRLVPPGEITELSDRLREHGAHAVEAVTFRMGHALASEPGTAPQPPTTEAVRVDGVLNDWFRERLATVTEPDPSAAATPEHSSGADGPGSSVVPQPTSRPEDPATGALTTTRRTRTPMGEPPAAGTPRPAPPWPAPEDDSDRSGTPLHLDGSPLETTTPFRETRP
jgi:hypothetical protein